MPPHHHQVIMNRFVAACQADARVVAATLYGSYARDAADTYSDLDLGLITTDAAYEDFVAKREAFIRLLGEPLFLEDFDLPNLVFVIFLVGPRWNWRLATKASSITRMVDLTGAARQKEPPGGSSVPPVPTCAGRANRNVAPPGLLVLA